jgi:hypothetical protein
MIGLLASANLSANASTVIYTVPTLKYSSFSFNVCNRNSVPITIRIALSETSTPSNSEYIEYDVSVKPKGVLERTGVILSDGWNLVAISSLANVSISVYGIEEVFV